MSLKVDSVVVLVKNGKTRASLAIPLPYARTLVQDVRRPPNIEFGRPMCIVRLKEWNRVLAREHALKLPRRFILVDTPSK